MEWNAKPIESERLCISEWTPQLANARRRADLQAQLAPMLTPETTHYLPASMAFPTGSNIASWVDARASEATVLTISQKAENALVGLLLLHVSENGQDVHVGYFFGSAFQGKGYATEALLALLAALKNMPIKNVYGGVDHDNIGSRKVLEKAGFVPAEKIGGQTIFHLSLHSSKSNGLGN